MSEHIRKHKLLVISDTALLKKDGVLMGFEPVVRELEVLANMFDEIVWLGSKISIEDTAVRMPNTKRIKMVQMPSVRNTRFNGLKMLMNYPVFLYYILKHFFSATHVHTRGPSHPALIGILLCYMSRKKQFWHKYAGNWIADNLSFTYRIQRMLLRNASFANVKVSVNGKWDKSPKHVLAFENPCFFESELVKARVICTEKNFSSKLNLLFVGGLVHAKGIMELMEVIEKQQLPESIAEVFIVGNGPLYSEIKAKADKITNLRVNLLGHLNRSEVDKYYSQSHIIILPSLSEGFPKVIAEAASYGCIPVVTNISSISQYIINGETGFLLDNNSPVSISTTLKVVANHAGQKKISGNASKMVQIFTYEHFYHRIENEIFNNSELSSIV